MAIYSLHHGHVGKATQKQPGTAGAHVHYITRDGAARLVMGEHIPTDRHQARTWMDEREAADRKNGRVIDKLMVALPLEMDGQQRADLVREFVQEIGGGRVSWMADVHDRGEDARNPHAHIILRDKDHDTGHRVFGTSEKGSTDRLREIWETVANRAMEREGIDARIDRRSLADQGIEREAGIHVGANVQAMEERGLRPESMAQDHTTSRGNDRVVNWPEIDQGRTRADRQREIEAMNREREDERGRGKDQQRAEHVPATETPAPELHQLDPLAERRAWAERLRGFQAEPQPVQEPQREAQAQERELPGAGVAEASPKATQQASYEVEQERKPPQSVELERERSRLEKIIEAGRERLASLAGRLEQAFQAMRQRHQDRQPIQVPDPPQIQQPGKPAADLRQEKQSPAAERDPWAEAMERGRKEREARSPPQRELERDTGRSLWDDWSQGRERKPRGPGW